MIEYFIINKYLTTTTPITTSNYLAATALLQLTNISQVKSPITSNKHLTTTDLLQLANTAQVKSPITIKKQVIIFP